MADAGLAEQDRPAVLDADRDRGSGKNRKREGKEEQGGKEISKRLEVEPAARGHKRSEIILRQVRQLHPSGQRFRELLVLVDDLPRERRIRKERLPFVRQVGGEVGNQ